MKSTLKSIAESCGVSISTVSLAINHPEKISSEIKDKIYTAMQEQNYNKTKKTLKNIIVFSKDMDELLKNAFYKEVVNGIISGTSEHNMSIKFINRENDLPLFIHEAGAIILLGYTPDDIYKRLKKYSIPVINCGHPSQNYQVSSIYFERESLTEHLINYILSCGHKNIAVVLGDKNNSITQKEFINTIQLKNPYYNDNMLFHADYGNIQTVEIILNQILSSKTKITAIMCENDVLAYYFYMCCEKYNVKIPEQLSITGFDGLSFPEWHYSPSPKLTTVSCDIKNLGRRTIDLLEQNHMKIYKNTLTDKMQGNLLIGDSVTRI